MNLKYIHILILSVALIGVVGMSIIGYYTYRSVRTIDGQEMQTSGASGADISGGYDEGLIAPQPIIHTDN